MFFPAVIEATGSLGGPQKGFRRRLNRLDVFLTTRSTSYLPKSTRGLPLEQVLEFAQEVGSLSTGPSEAFCPQVVISSARKRTSRGPLSSECGSRPIRRISLRLQRLCPVPLPRLSLPLGDVRTPMQSFPHIVPGKNRTPSRHVYCRNFRPTKANATSFLRPWQGTGKRFFLPAKKLAKGKMVLPRDGFFSVVHSPLPNWRIPRRFLYDFPLFTPLPMRPSCSSPG